MKNECGITNSSGEQADDFCEATSDIYDSAALCANRGPLPRGVALTAGVQTCLSSALAASCCHQASTGTRLIGVSFVTSTFQRGGLSLQWRNHPVEPFVDVFVAVKRNALADDVVRKPVHMRHPRHHLTHSLQTNGTSQSCFSALGERSSILHSRGCSNAASQALGCGPLSLWHENHLCRQRH